MNFRGFSLIELMFVLALVALVSVLAIPSMGFMCRRLVKTQAEQLLMTVLYLQREAMVGNARKKIFFDIARNQYRYNDIVVKFPNGVLFGVVFGAKGPPSSGVGSPSKAVTYKKSEAVFFPDGKVSAGSVYLTDKNHECMYAITTPVSHLSYIRMYKYYQGSWDQLR